MKRLFTLFIAALLIAPLAHAQNGWVTHKGDNRISGKFPSEPREFIPGSFMTVTRDSSIVYIFTIVDFVQVAGVDSVALAPMKATPAGTDSKAKQYDMFMFIIGNKLYSLSTVIVNGASLQTRDDYFASVQLSN